MTELRDRDNHVKIGNLIICPHYDMSNEEWTKYAGMVENSKKAVGTETTKKLVLKTAEDLK